MCSSQPLSRPMRQGSKAAACLALFLMVVAHGAVDAVGVGAGGDGAVRIYVVGHGWHTGLVVPNGELLRQECPALTRFAGWDFVEIGWGDEGFYRGGASISLEVALKAVAVPTPTVLHIVGVGAPVETFFSGSELIAIDISATQFAELVRFVGAAFELRQESPIDLGPGIYGDSQFFRAHGSYYFPNTCNVWTLKALKAAGLRVFPPAGIRTENVIAQASKHGEILRRFPGRSRLSVLVATVVATAMVVWLRNMRRLVLWAWAALVLALASRAAITMAEVNGVDLPDYLQGLASFACWAAAAAVAAAHFMALRTGFRWWHALGATVAALAIAAGLSPL